MNDLNELVKILHVGTHRMSLPVDEPSRLSPERRALQAASTIGLMTRAGASLNFEATSIPACPPENASIAWKSEALLHEALESAGVSVVVEWAREAAKLGKVAPPSVSGLLFPLLAKHKKVILPVIGARGRWLAELQDRLLGQDEGFDGQLAANPEAFRQWLAEEYDALDWKERVAALKALHVHALPKDEPLLQRGLKDRRREVRDAAFYGLMAIEGSEIHTQVLELATPILSLRKKLLSHVLEVNPPEPDQLPKWLPRSAAVEGIGPKAHALIDVVRLVSPRHWPVPIWPDEFLELAWKGEYGLAITSALVESAVHFQEQDWIDALLAHLFKHDAGQRQHWKNLVRHASEGVFDRNVLAILSNRRANVHIAATALFLREKPLSLPVSRAVVEEFAGEANLDYVLSGISTYLHPDVLELLESKPDASERAVKMVSIRKRLLDSLQD